MGIDESQSRALTNGDEGIEIEEVDMGHRILVDRYPLPDLRRHFGVQNSAVTQPPGYSVDHTGRVGDVLKYMTAENHVEGFTLVKVVERIAQLLNGGPWLH